MNKTQKPANNYAFIDSQNLNLGVRLDVSNYKGKDIYNGHSLDYKKFRNYLRNKYDVKQAYLFIGFIASNNNLYTYLQSVGYTLVFKTVTSYTDANGKEINKGNVDTDLVLYSAAILYKDYDQAVFVSGDGDFLSLYDYMDQNNKLLRILVPNRHRYSKLLNNYRNKLGFVSDVKPLLQPIKKTRSDVRLKTLGLPDHGDTKIIVTKNSKNNNSKSTKKTRSDGRLKTLGLPGLGDNQIVAKNANNTNIAKGEGK